MGSYVKNELHHRVVVGDATVPGDSVAWVEDDEAVKTLTSYEGVTKLNQSDGKAAVDAQSAGPSEESPGEDEHRRLAELAVEHRTSATSAPLQLVVGDDDAPLGPPQGTVTTKQMAAAEGPTEKSAFADHEHMPEDLGEQASDVEQRQAERTAAVEEVAARLAGGEEEAPPPEEPPPA